MKMNKIISDDRHEQKQFALMMSWAIPLFFYILLPWLFSWPRHWWPFAVSACFLLLYGLMPQFIKYPYRLWMFISQISGWVNTRIILGISFYLIIFPMGVLLRIFNKLHYQSAINKQKNSYYIVRDEKINKADLERPF